MTRVPVVPENEAPVTLAASATVAPSMTTLGQGRSAAMAVSANPRRTMRVRRSDCSPPPDSDVFVLGTCPTSDVVSNPLGCRVALPRSQLALRCPNSTESLWTLGWPLGYAAFKALNAENGGGQLRLDGARRVVIPWL